jgi:Ca2+-transporting ATPase
VYILIAAFGISIFLGEQIDAAVIGVILVLIAISGFIMEYRAEKAIEALKKMASLKAIVIRDNKEHSIDAINLVPGDVVVLETGEKVPADARIIEAVNLQTQEAALTGESTPVKKEDVVLKEKTSMADQINMVFSGTIVTAGRAKAVITQTGMKTEIGKIAEMIAEAKPEPTHLQKNLDRLGKWIGWAVIVIAIIVFIAGMLKGELKLLEMFIFAVALAVAAIPEGLPAVVTICLALGVQRMVKRNALIRKLPSVETLGSTTVICTDKTGTLTCNQMTVKKIYVNSKEIEVTGSGYATEGIFKVGKKIMNPNSFSRLLQIGSLCNDAKFSGKELIGDPTEGALIVSAEKAGIKKNYLEHNYPRMGELGFSSERKRMSTFHKINGKKTVLCKGAPDVILELCDRILVNGEIKRLGRLEKKKILEFNEKFSNEALRVLGFAYKESSTLNEKDMVFVGLQGMIDPPRPDVKDAIAKCKKAGIKIVMITGDYIGTAKAIGKEIGLEGKAITGQELDEIKNLSAKVEGIGIYARVDPRHKVKILDALKKKGHVVAMTGDGVNDAPALKEADIGVSMGITGTDVAKEASDMILTDDNFSSIVNAVEEGRGIYDNIKKFVNYLLSANVGEVLVIFLSIVMGMGAPLIAIQILWINLVTDGLPALALGVDPASPRIMERKPRNPKQHILTKNTTLNILVVGILMSIACLVLFKKYYLVDLIKAQTVVFTTLVVLEIARVYMIRSQYNIGVFSNKFLILAILSSMLLHLIVLYTPLNVFFKTVPLGITEWIYIIGATVGVFIVGMLSTFVIRKVTNEAD